MKIISTKPLASQSFSCSIGGQSCSIKLYSKSGTMYLDLAMAGVTIAPGCIMRDRVAIIRRSYLGFSGDLMVVDQFGSSDPAYDEMGSRFLLYYLTDDEIEALV